MKLGKSTRDLLEVIDGLEEGEEVVNDPDAVRRGVGGRRRDPAPGRRVGGAGRRRSSPRRNDRHPTRERAPANLGVRLILGRGRRAEKRAILGPRRDDRAGSALHPGHTAWNPTADGLKTPRAEVPRPALLIPR